MAEPEPEPTPALTRGREANGSAATSDSRFREACDQIPRWRFTNGRDCAIAENRCGGIVDRRAWEHATCLKGLP